MSISMDGVPVVMPSPSLTFIPVLRFCPITVRVPVCPGVSTLGATLWIEGKPDGIPETAGRAVCPGEALMGRGWLLFLISAFPEAAAPSAFMEKKLNNRTHTTVLNRHLFIIPPWLKLKVNIGISPGYNTFLRPLESE